MRNILLAAVAMATLATPALARDGQPYIGIEGGALFGEDPKLDVLIDDGTDIVGYENGVINEFKSPGWEADAIAGYDFGPVRAEAELGYKRLRTKNLFFSPALAGDLGLPDDGPYAPDDVGLSRKTEVLSAMGNVLLDLGDDNGFSIYGGGGAGYARVKMFGDRDNSWAWQLIAGARVAVTDSVDLGLKYRYFNTGNLTFADRLGDAGVGAEGKLRSHSVLASLIFNFGGREPEPTPPVADVPG